MKKIFIFLLVWYQKILSPDKGILVRLHIKPPGSHCGFYPSCSEYTIQAIEKYGSRRGLYKGGKRILRCHPFQKQSVDFP